MRGSVVDIIWVVAVIGAFSLFLLVFTTMNMAFNTAIQNSPVVNISAAANISQSATTQQITSWNLAFPWIYIGLNLSALAFSFLVRVHPIFFVFAILVLVVTVIFAAIFSNTYSTVANVPGLQSAANQLPFVSLVMDNLVISTIIFGFIDAILMYTSFGAASQQPGGGRLEG
jgi:hypothetical protein